MKSKECKRCHNVFGLDNFYKSPITKDRRQSYCKKCDKEISKENYIKNRKDRIKKRWDWITENRERHNEIARNYQDRKRLSNMHEHG